MGEKNQHFDFSDIQSGHLTLLSIHIENPEITEIVLFPNPKTTEILHFLDPEIVKMDKQIS